MSGNVIFREGDIVTARKPHPCGGREWLILKVGADYKIKCTTCQHVVMLGYDKLRKLIK